MATPETKRLPVLYYSITDDQAHAAAPACSAPPLPEKRVVPSGLHALQSTGLSWFMEALGMACPVACTSQQQTWLFQKVPAMRLEVGLNVMLLTPSLAAGARGRRRGPWVLLAAWG